MSDASGREGTLMAARGPDRQEKRAVVGVQGRKPEGRSEPLAADRRSDLAGDRGQRARMAVPSSAGAGSPPDGPAAGTGGPQDGRSEPPGCPPHRPVTELAWSPFR